MTLGEVWSRIISLTASPSTIISLTLLQGGGHIRIPCVTGYEASAVPRVICRISFPFAIAGHPTRMGSLDPLYNCNSRVSVLRKLTLDWHPLDCWLLSPSMPRFVLPASPSLVSLYPCRSGARCCTGDVSPASEGYSAVTASVGNTACASGCRLWRVMACRREAGSEASNDFEPAFFRFVILFTILLGDLRPQGHS